MTIAYNFATMTEYAGSNATLRGNAGIDAFASFKQINELGYKVKKGAKSIPVFCGYRPAKDAKNSETVPCWGRVFDISDTTAMDDKDFLAWMTENPPAPSQAQINAEIGAMLLGGK